MEFRKPKHDSLLLFPELKSFIVDLISYLKGRIESEWFNCYLSGEKMSAKSSVGEEAVEWGRAEEEDEAAFIEETPTPLYLSTTIWGR